MLKCPIATKTHALPLIAHQPESRKLEDAHQSRLYVPQSKELYAHQRLDALQSVLRRDQRKDASENLLVLKLKL